MFSLLSMISFRTTRLLVAPPFRIGELREQVLLPPTLESYRREFYDLEFDNDSE